MTVKDMREKRAAAITQARALLERVKTEGRNAPTADEDRQYEAWIKEAQDLKATIDRDAALETEERALATAQPTAAAGRENPGAEQRAPRGTFEFRGRQIPLASPEHRAAYSRWLAVGNGDLTTDERRALQADSDTVGGFLRPDQEFAARLIQAVDNDLFIRQKATKLTVSNADSLGVPSLDTDIDDADWTSELGTGNEDSAMAFGKRELRPHPLAKRIKVSNKLLRQTGASGVLDAETIVRERLAYKFGVSQEKAFLTGTGSGQPLGIFTASALGISTGRDVSTGNTTTAIQTDGLQEAYWTLKPQYRMRADWMFHSDALKQVAKLKDGDGNYIWQRGNIASGAPDTLLTRPYMESQYASSTFTTGLYVGMLGDFSTYWIVDALTFQVQRLVELYAATNQTGFIGRLETDGMPVLEEAWVRVKLV